MINNSITTIFATNNTMENLQIHIKVSDKFYIKDPDSTDLGRKIISKSIELIEDLGFEAFTFKKLGLAIGSPESSIYRYFTNKHHLLIYLICWYWSWLEYKIVFGTFNIKSPSERLKITLDILTHPIEIDHKFEHINETYLNQIVISESTKVFHTKAIDKENELGFFKVYKRLIQRISDIILEINPDYNYPHMLVSTVVEGAHQQIYFAEHLPSLSDSPGEKDCISNFYTKLVFNAIR